MVSKYNKSSSKTNLHDNSFGGSMFAQRLASNKSKEKIEANEDGDDFGDRATDSFEESEEDIDAFI